MSLSFTNPLMLLLLIPFCGIILWTYFLRSKKKRYRYQGLILTVRLVLGILVIVALSGIHLKWVTDDITTVFVVDVSDSTSKLTEKINTYIVDQLDEKGEKDKVGIVAFGKNSTVEQFISSANTFTKLSSKPVKTSTDMESAINYALALMPENTAKRIVLVTDGRENYGNIANTESSLLARKVEFDVLILENEKENEVYVSNLSLPDRINVGDTFTINVSIESNVATDATLYLYSGKSLKGSKKVKLQKGTNKLVFKDTQTEKGTKDYRIICEAADGNDSISINNEYSATTIAQVPPKILVVEGESDNSKEFRKILDSIGMDYDVVATNVVPTDISDMAEYKGAVLVDVYAKDLKKGFLENLESYVGTFGNSVIAIGGENSFAIGGYRDTALEEVLPVYMDLEGDKVVPKIAMALVIDRSSSMEAKDAHGKPLLAVAKEAAIATLDNLREIDDIGVLAFGDNYKWVVPFQPAEDKEELSTMIAGIGINGGTDIQAAVDEAVKKMKDSDATIKHVIVLTDGQDGNYAYDGIIKTANDNSITISSVGMGDAPDAMLLKYIAESCNGRYYIATDSTNLPRIFAQEVFLSSGEYLVNREFTPRILNGSSILTGVIDEGLPSMLGYVASTPKENARVILQSDDDAPILSTLQYGLGKTVAWNTDVTNEWTKNYAGTELYQRLWKNIFDWALADVTSGDNGVVVSEENGKVTVKYYSENISDKNSVNMTIQDDNGNSNVCEMALTAPGEYVAEFETDATGIYSLNVAENEEGKTVSSINTSAIVQYSKEYRVLEYDDDFEAKVKNMNANVLKSHDIVFESDLEQVSGKVPIDQLCLIIALIIFVIDIIVRRLSLEKYIYYFFEKIGYGIAGLFGKKTNNVGRKSNDKKKSSIIKDDTVLETDDGDNEDNSKRKKSKPKKQKEAKKRKKDAFAELNNANQLDTSALLDKQRQRNRYER